MAQLELDTATRARLADWFVRTLGDTTAAIAIAPLSGGLVNASYVVTATSAAAARRFLLRWDPIEGPQAPYDMPLQFRVFEALRRTHIPVPEPLWLETDPAVLGRDFWVSEFVDAETIGRMINPDDPLAEARTNAFVAMLNQIHQADWRSADVGEVVPVIGAADLAGLIEAETQFLDGARTAEDRALFERARAFLHAQAPKHFDLCLTHGDCSLSNYLFRREAIVAVVDWDLALITDRMRDLSFYLTLIFRFNPERPLALKEAERRQFIERYAAISNAPLDHLAFWEAYSNYHNALSWTRAGWTGPTNGYEPYKARLEALIP